MKRYQSGAEKRKKIKKQLEIAESQKNALHKFFTVNAEEDLPKGSDNSVSPSLETIERHIDVENTEEGLMDNQEVTNAIEENSENANAKDMPESRFDVDTEIINDIALWPTTLTDAMLDYILENKPKNIGNIDNMKSLYKDRDEIYYRGLSNDHFYRKKSNGTMEKRNWLIFSETSKSVYCYPCKLFSTSKSKLVTGLQNWRSITVILSGHETSKEHISAMCTMYKRSTKFNRIDTQLLEQEEKEVYYWREVLKRIVSTIKLLSSLGLGFRGHDESQFSNRKGNYLTCIEYLSEYDEFLKLHLQKYGNQGRGNVNYLSHSICDEFVSLISNQVRAEIIQEIKSANYYSIIVDSTPDISHVDQLTFVIRYVSSSGAINERFLEFIPIDKHTSSYLEQEVLQTLIKYGLDIKNCRGQSFDNAANMSGKYSGLQARIKEYSPNAVFVPCTNHSLNLVGNFAAEECGSAIQYFMFIQNLFTFFSSSTSRWKILNRKLELSEHSVSVKRISDTRWSARADAVLAVKQGYNSIKEALNEICDSKEEKKATVLEANSLRKKMNKYEIVLMTVIWNKILQRINATHKSLQSKDCDLMKGSILLKSLEAFINNFRQDFEKVEKEATDLSGVSFNVEEDESRRRKKRKIFFDENKELGYDFTTKQSFIVNSFYVICDNLKSELSLRGKTYEMIVKPFRIFFDSEMPKEEEKKAIQNLKDIYKNDIDVDIFEDEFEQFSLFLKENEDIKTISEIHKAAKEMSCTFPNVEVLLKIFRTIPLSNATGERSFSVLKRVKNYLRSTMGEERLNNMAILYIEKDIFNRINIDKIIDQFAKSKARRKFI
jgi:hypothetical protein